VLPYSTSDGGNKGIDIAGKRGQPVYAAGAGKVVYVGNQLRGYGNLIMIKHNEDYISAYAHNDKLMVNNGQSVKIGQQIATMGSSDADSVRLHFQIRYRATAIDPLRYLPPQAVSLSAKRLFYRHLAWFGLVSGCVRSIMPSHLSRA
jgi:lipoprotein YgeR